MLFGCGIFLAIQPQLLANYKIIDSSLAMHNFVTEMPLWTIAAFIRSNSCLCSHLCSPTPFAVKMSLCTSLEIQVWFLWGYCGLQMMRVFACAWCPQSNGKHYTRLHSKFAFKVKKNWTGLWAKNTQDLIQFLKYLE